MSGSARSFKLLKRVRRTNLAAFAVVLFLVLLFPGCARVPSAERGELADPMMIFGEDPLDQGVYEQHRDYREGSVGGTNAQGGGCGCG